jgi:hypothetical protein
MIDERERFDAPMTIIRFVLSFPWVTRSIWAPNPPPYITST